VNANSPTHFKIKPVGGGSGRLPLCYTSTYLLQFVVGSSQPKSLENGWNSRGLAVSSLALGLLNTCIDAIDIDNANGSGPSQIPHWLN